MIRRIEGRQALTWTAERASYLAALEAVCCRRCAGTGRLTSSLHLVAKDGQEIAPRIVDVRPCPDCGGTGFDDRD